MNVKASYPSQASALYMEACVGLSPYLLLTLKEGYVHSGYLSFVWRIDETIDHAIFIFPRARQIWHMVGYQIRESGMVSSMASFLSDIRRGNQQQGVILVATAYQIWLSRN